MSPAPDGEELNPGLSHSDGFSLSKYVRTRRFVVRVVMALALIGAADLAGRTFLAWGAFVALGILIVPVRRSRSFLLAFVPYVGMWLIFAFLRAFADETILAQTLNTKVASFERWLFGGQLPTVMLQDRFFDPNHLHVWDYYFTLTHWSYFIIPHLVAVRLWYKHPDRFRQYLAGMGIVLSVTLIIYFLIPSNPPWMAPEPIDSPAAAPVYRVMELVAKQIGGGLYSASYSVIGQSNPIAAMPSEHFATTFFLVFVARKSGRGWFIASLYYALTMAITLIYCGEHYFTDVMVGGLVATYGWFAAGTWLRLSSPVLQSRPAVVAQRFRPGKSGRPAEPSPVQQPS